MLMQALIALAIGTGLIAVVGQEIFVSMRAQSRLTEVIVAAELEELTRSTLHGRGSLAAAVDANPPLASCFFGRGAECVAGEWFPVKIAAGIAGQRLDGRYTRKGARCPDGDAADTGRCSVTFTITFQALCPNSAPRCAKARTILFRYERVAAAKRTSGVVRVAVPTTETTDENYSCPTDDNERPQFAIGITGRRPDCQIIPTPPRTFVGFVAHKCGAKEILVGLNPETKKPVCEATYVD